MFVGIVKDGRVRFYEAEDGSLEEQGGWRIPGELTAEQVAILGLNIRGFMEAVASTAEAAPPATPAPALHPPQPGIFTSTEVLELIQQQGPLRIPAIAAITGLAVSQVKSRIDRLRTDRKITLTERGYVAVSVPLRRQRGRPSSSPVNAQWTSQRVLELIQSQPGITQRKLREATGMSVKAASNRLGYLKNARKAIRIDVEGRCWPVETPAAPAPEPVKAETPAGSGIRSRSPRSDRAED